MKKKTNQYTIGSKILTWVFAALCLVWVIPVFEVLINSFKGNTFVSLEPFAMPNAESFAGFDNYVKGMTFGNYPFLKSVLYSLFITVVSVALILLFCSMAAWYIARVKSVFAKVFYYLCLFSMIVPFQMVMFTL
ncbi:MAG: carbohydrate ABC transporter permease, partial [Clostridia bacterium]|nr:carbohydrate ABC transporter permease [Clostridia bacterium]